MAENNPELDDSGRQDGWRIQMRCRPARSPGMNVLDLGLFSALQSIQYRQESCTLEGLIDAVNHAWNQIPSQTIDDVFLTLQKVLECVILHEGGNDYKLPRSR